MKVLRIVLKGGQVVDYDTACTVSVIKDSLVVSDDRPGKKTSMHYSKSNVETYGQVDK